MTDQQCMQFTEAAFQNSVNQLGNKISLIESKDLWEQFVTCYRHR